MLASLNTTAQILTILLVCCFGTCIQLGRNQLSEAQYEKHCHLYGKHVNPRRSVPRAIFPSNRPKESVLKNSPRSSWLQNEFTNLASHRSGPISGNELVSSKDRNRRSKCENRKSKNRDSDQGAPSKLELFQFSVYAFN